MGRPDDATTELRNLQTTRTELDAMDEAELLEHLKTATSLARHHERRTSIAHRLVRLYWREILKRREQ